MANCTAITAQSLESCSYVLPTTYTHPYTKQHGIPHGILLSQKPHEHSKEQYSTRNSFLALLNLLHLLSNIAFAHTSLPHTLRSHLGRHPNPGVATKTAHLDGQKDQVDVLEAEIRSLGIEEVDHRNKEGLLKPVRQSSSLWHRNGTVQNLPAAP